MPIWFELIVLLLGAYGIGMAIGWLIWCRRLTRQVDEETRTGMDHE